MAEMPADTTATVMRIECEERVFPPYDGFHATPSAMLWRRLSVSTPAGSATFEQTDYGHPGRLNPWEPRGIAAPLLQRLTELKALAEAVGAVLDAGKRG